jgi:glycosyltransferase involved in cell wall biosynthesis
MAEHQPLVSIITAFLNEERFLQEAVESVLKQSYTNWELFLVDDGSSDRSTAIAKKYEAENFGKIIYLEHDNHSNKGLSASRNFAIEKSKGEFIAILDADDVWLSEKLKDQVAILIKYPEVGMVCGAYEYWHSWRNDGKEDVIVSVGGPQDQPTKAPLMLTHLYPLSKGDAPCPSDVMIKRFVYDKYAQFEGGVFVGDYQFYEDQPFFCKIYFNTSVYITSKCYLRYRQRSNSLVSMAHTEGKYDRVRIFFLDWLGKYMKQHNFNHPAVLRAYRKALFPYRHPLLNKLKDRIYRVLYPVIKRIKSRA